MIIIDGPMGSGKTTIGRLLHKELPRTAILSTDAIKFFISDFERCERDKAITTAVLFAMCKEYAKQGINVLLPQGFWKKEYIDPYIAFAKEHDLALFIYQLEAPRDVLLQRIANRPTPAGRTPPPQERIMNNLQTWDEHKFAAGTVFNTEEMSAEQVAQHILEDIRNASDKKL